VARYRSRIKRARGERTASMGRLFHLSHTSVRAPASTRARAASRSPIRDAYSRAVSSPLDVRRTSAPAASSAFMAPVWPLAAAHMSGVVPYVSPPSTLAPAASSAAIAVKCAYDAAISRGVVPPTSALGSAPASRAAAMPATSPRSAASHSVSFASVAIALPPALTHAMPRHTGRASTLCEPAHAHRTPHTTTPTTCSHPAPPPPPTSRADKTGPSAPATPPGGPLWRPPQGGCTGNRAVVSFVPPATRTTRLASHLAFPTRDGPSAPAIPPRRSPAGYGRAGGRGVGALEVRHHARAAGARRHGSSEVGPRGADAGVGGWVGGWVFFSRTPSQPHDAIRAREGGGRGERCMACTRKLQGMRAVRLPAVPHATTHQPRDGSGGGGAGGGGRARHTPPPPPPPPLPPPSHCITSHHRKPTQPPSPYASHSHSTP
jgi:hypothetical protein